MSGDEPLFCFAQLEFPRALGPADGRYVVRDGPGEAPSHVLVLRTLGAAERRKLVRRRRPAAAEPEPTPAPVPTTRATVIEAGPLESEDAAAASLAQARDQAEERLAAALSVLNRALSAHAVAAGDPNVAEVSREQALVARLGWGRGEQVAEGRWAEAVEVPPSRERRRRAETLRPQERLAALLGGRDRPLAAELLALRTRQDLDQGRAREAALQLRVALEAGIVELEGSDQAATLGERLTELRARREAVGSAANEALRGPLADETRQTVGQALGRLEAALRVRALAALDAPSESR